MLEIKNALFSYGKQLVLDGFSAGFQKGKLTCIIGQNGCGKSTLLKTALGILPLTQGEIALDGKNLNEMNRIEIARKIAYLPQEKKAPDMTVFQMVLHGRFPYLSYPRRYAKRDMEIANHAMTSVGIFEQKDKPLYTLSGGMRQNAYIAMALAQDTDYILLDEPTTHLDIAHQLELMNMLRKLAKGGKGIVTVMHDLPLAFEFADEILVIQNGKLKAQQRPGELCNSSVIHEIFNVKMHRIGDTGKYYYA